MWKIWFSCVFLAIILRIGICKAGEYEADTCNSCLNRLDKHLQILNSYDEILKSRLATLDKQLNKFRRIDEIIDLLLSLKYNKQKPGTPSVPSNCAQARQSGVYSIKVKAYGPNKFDVYCDTLTQGGGWTVIQRRQDGSVDFLRNWDDYKNGFGDLNGEFFIGLEKLHALTTETPQELLIVMEDFYNNTRLAKYDAFAIGNEDEAYALNLLGSYSGDAGDSFTFQVNQKFTTIDRDNDISPLSNCAQDFQGAWWYAKCHASNLNGLYLKGEYSKDKYAQGVVWHSWKGHYYSLKSVRMLIRPVRK